MSHPELFPLVVMAMVLVLFAVPAVLGMWRGVLSKWAAIAISTISSPVLMLGAGKLVTKAYWAAYRDLRGGGCAGGECGAAGYAAGYWPIFVAAFFVAALIVSFFVSWIVVAALRNSRS